MEEEGLTGKVTQAEAMTLSNPGYAVAMNTPTGTLAAAGSNIAASVVLNGTPAGVMAVADVDLSKAKVTLTSKTVKISGVVVKLNPTAAGVLNQVFQVSGFTPGFEVGTATVRGPQEALTASLRGGPHGPRRHAGASARSLPATCAP